MIILVAMTPSIMHRDTERDVKTWLADQHCTHGTDVAKFTEFTGTEYQKEVAELGLAIYQYVPEEEKRAYTQTITLDWK